MRTQALLATAVALIAALELPAQRGRRGGRPEGGGPPATTPTAAPADTAPKKASRYVAVVGGDVYLGTGQRITGGTVLIGDDKIEAVGLNLTLPEGTEIIDAKGKCVSPGFVCVLGNGMGAPRTGPFADGVNPFDPEIKQGLAAGITSFFVGSTSGSGPTPGGNNAVIKLAYGNLEGMVLRENAVVGLSVPLSLADREKFQESVKKAREYIKAVEEFPAKKAADNNLKEPAMPPGADKIVAVMRGEARLWISLGGGFNPFGLRRGGAARSNDVDQIGAALEIAQWLGEGVVLQKPMSAWMLPEQIAATGSMVFLCPRDHVPADPADPDHTGSNIASAALLAAAGVPVAVTCPSGPYAGAGVGTGGLLGQDLNTPNVDAAYAVRGGLDNRKALRTLTLDAARMLGVDARIGSLEPRKDADLLILDGDPLHYATFVETAIVNGKVVYEKAKEPLYQHIQRRNQ